MEINEKETLFVEKYRPRTIDSCILPNRLKDYFKEMVNSDVMQNMILSGPAGVGKTTVAKALCEEMGIEYLFLNASENGNIDTLRTTLRSFASTVSFTSSKKTIILDEADFLTPLVQASLRGFIEEFSSNCRFILTVNHENKIIDAIKSRCPIINFNLTKEEKSEVLKPLDARLKEILKIENIEYDKKTLAMFVLKYVPDIRRILNQLQRHTNNNILSDNVITSISNDSIKQLFSYLKDGSKWGEMRKWVVDNIDNDFTTIVRNIYDRSSEFVKPSALPQLVLILSDYDSKLGFCSDRELHTVACLTQIMMDIEFK